MCNCSDFIPEEGNVLYSISGTMHLNTLPNDSGAGSESDCKQVKGEARPGVATDNLECGRVTGAESCNDPRDPVVSSYIVPNLKHPKN